MATEIAAIGGNVQVMKWLLTHFQDCQVSVETVEEAATNGHLTILQYLLDQDTNNTKREGPAVKKRKVGTGEEDKVPDMSSKSRGGGHVVCWVNESETCRTCVLGLTARHEHSDVARWLHGNAPGQKEQGAIREAIQAAVQAGDMELAEFLLPTGTTVLDHVGLGGKCPQMIEQMLGAGVFERFEDIDALALPDLARSRRLDLMQRVAEHYEPNIRLWQKQWRNALIVACCRGNQPMIIWMIKHPMWRKVRKLMSEKGTFLIFCGKQLNTVASIQCSVCANSELLTTTATLWQKQWLRMTWTV